MTRTQTVDFELPNVGVGPDPLSADAIATSADFAVLLPIDEPSAPDCQLHVDAVAGRAAEFRDREAAIVIAVPEPVDSARDWNDDHELPFPLLADPGNEGGESNPNAQFGAFESLGGDSGVPDAALVDTRIGEPRLVETFDGTHRPGVDDLLAAIADQREQFIFDVATS